MNGTAMSKEPAAIIGTIGLAIIAAIEILGPEFFPDLEPILIQAVQAIVVVLSFLTIRMKVFSPATHEAEVAEALRTPAPDA